MADEKNEAAQRSDQEDPGVCDDGGKGEGEVKEADIEVENEKSPAVEEVEKSQPVVKEIPTEASIDSPSEALINPPVEEPTISDKSPSDSASNCSFHLPTNGGDSSEVCVKSLEEILLEQVVDLLFWRDVRASGLVFVFSLIILLSLQCFSIIAVTAYLALALLAVTVSIRLYKFVLQTLNGTQQPNPFQSLLDADISISREMVDRYMDMILRAVNCVIISTRDLILVRNLPSSIKFGLSMWLLTYVGACFNGLTFLTLDLVLAFSLPPFYEKYQKPIDTYHAMACKKLSEIYTQIKSKIPGSKQKSQ